MRRVADQENESVEGWTRDPPRTNDEAARAYESSLRFLACRPRSKAEVRRRLARQYTPAAVQSAILRLERVALVDDAAFARYWVDQRQQFSPRGPRALRVELRLKGVPTALADAAVEPTAALEEDSAFRAGLRYARKLRTPNEAAFSRVLGSYLARRGFASAAIRGAVPCLWQTIRESAALSGA